MGKPGQNMFKMMEWGLYGMQSLNPIPHGEWGTFMWAGYTGHVAGTDLISFIPQTLVPDAITMPEGEKLTWYGRVVAGLSREDQFTPYEYPLPGNERIHMIWTDTPCWSTCWNGGNRMQEALRHPSIEFYLVQHPWMENDTMFADIILPTNTKFETADIGTDNDSGQWNVVFYEKQAIKPIGESVSDKEAVGIVAKKLESYGGIYEGIYDKYLGGKTDEEWIRVGFESSGAPEDLSFDEFVERQYYAFPTREDWKEIPAGLIEFYEDPEGHPLRTPSGKLEYYSTTLASYFPDDKERGPIPHWIDEGAGHQERQYLERGRKYPFLLVSNHPHFRVHAQHDDATWFREIETCKVKGPDGYLYEPLWVNPIDAGKLGLETGDVAKIYNERGAVLGGVLVSERIMPGAVYQDHGARCDTIVLGEGGLDRGGANNLIAPTPTTSKNAAGEVTSGFLVNVEKEDVFKLAQEYPEAFERAYDPACGLVATARIVEGE